MHLMCKALPNLKLYIYILIVLCGHRIPIYMIFPKYIK